jgi:histidinol-phosphate aminotransferase
MRGVTSDERTAAEIDFGAQGGDPTREVRIDLSTCVNRYGPAPAAVEALHAVKPEDILLHPYDAADRMKALYEWATGVDPAHLVAGRGASEFIWAMGREVDPAGVAIPLPAYTDYLKAFPGRGFTVNGEQLPTLELVDAALSAAQLVIISNPHNPTGVQLPRDGLLSVAAEHPRSTLVVDESYINFAPDPIGRAVINCDLPNVVVIRSTSKFYGIAAVRAGVAWCRDVGRLRDLFGVQENWGLSGVDVTVAEAAVRSWDWSGEVRARMHADSAWLADELEKIPGVQLVRNDVVHFQYAFCERSAAVADVFARHGIGVRVLSKAHGVRPDALRIVAPREDERDVVAAALADIVQSGVSTG